MAGLDWAVRGGWGKMYGYGALCAVLQCFSSPVPQRQGVGCVVQGRLLDGEAFPMSSDATGHNGASP